MEVKSLSHKADLKSKQQMALLIVLNIFNPVVHTETLRRAEQPHRVFLEKAKEIKGGRLRPN